MARQHKTAHLGCLATAEEAALHVARTPEAADGDRAAPPYDCGRERGASQDGVRKRYLALALRLHPDKGTRRSNEVCHRKGTRRSNECSEPTLNQHIFETFRRGNTSKSLQTHCVRPPRPPPDRVTCDPEVIKNLFQASNLR